MNSEQLKTQILNCLEYEDEREWFEFKENAFDVDEIGKYISALSNSAAILGKESAYLIWGVSDKDKKIVGTNIYYNAEVKNEPIKHILARKLTPSILFDFKEIQINKKD